VSAFGGPTAHIGYFRAAFVQHRQWLDDAEFAELVALCQCLPGPASSQIAFALGLRRAGLRGALVASACFTLPSALLMVAFAAGAATLLDAGAAGALEGLMAVAVAVVAHAVWGMGRRLCPDAPRVALCALATCLALALRTPWAHAAAIALGALLGRLALPSDAVTSPGALSVPAALCHPSRRAGAVALWVGGALLIACAGLSATSPPRVIEAFQRFYLSGAMVFGGGHVVLPLLRAEVVPAGWLTDAQFLAGYAAAQAVPGPLFTFAAYLGAAMSPGPWSAVFGLWCLVALFLPGWLVVYGALPFWAGLRAHASAQRALAGMNAAVVGLLLAALWDPVIVEAIRAPRHALIACVALALLGRTRAPIWSIVALGAGVGLWRAPG